MRPDGPTRLAIARLNRPVPAPMSATTLPRVIAEMPARRAASCSSCHGRNAPNARYTNPAPPSTPAPIATAANFAIVIMTAPFARVDEEQTLDDVRQR